MGICSKTLKQKRSPKPLAGLRSEFTAVHQHMARCQGKLRFEVLGPCAGNIVHETVANTCAAEASFAVLQSLRPCLQVFLRGHSSYDYKLQAAAHIFNTWAANGSDTAALAGR